MSCEKVSAEPKEGDVVWHAQLREYVTLGKALIRHAKRGNTSITVFVCDCQTHEDRLKEAHDYMTRAIDEYCKLAKAQQNTTNDE